MSLSDLVQRSVAQVILVFALTLVAASAQAIPEKLLEGEPGDGIQVFAAPEGDFDFRVHGQLQPRAVIFDGGEDTDLSALIAGDPDDREGFSLRRARFGFSGRLSKHFAYKMTFGHDSRFDQVDKTVRPETEGIALLDGYMEWVTTPYIQARVGASHVPFGGQSLQSSAGLQMIERSVAAERIGPDRDAGIRLHGSIAGPQKPISSRNASTSSLASIASPPTRART